MDALLQNPNVRQFLNLIGDAEGANYDTIVGGGTMSDFAAHPNKVGLVTANGPSTAAGRYQIVNSTYQPYAKKLGVSDFSPLTQDKIALALIADNGALPDVLSGNYQKAVSKLGGTWASLPSSPYSQPKRSSDWVAKQVSNPMASNDEWGVKNTAPIGQADEWGVAATRPISGPEPDMAPPMARGRPTMQNDPRIVDPNAPAPKGVPEPTLGERITKGLGMGTRAVLKGATSIDYPVRAGFDAISVVPNLLGYKDAANYIHNNLGTGGSAGGAIADAAGLAKPQNKFDKFIGGATEGATGLLTGGALQKGVQAATGAASPILEALAPTVSKQAASTALPQSGKVAQEMSILKDSVPALKEAGALSALQGGVEAVPEAALPILATVGAVRGGKALKGEGDKWLTERAASKIDPTQAEIIKDLGILKQGDPKAVLNAAKLNTLGSSYVDEAVMKLEQAGLMTPELKFAVDNRQVLATKPGLLDSIRKTPEGEALYQAMAKDASLGMMTAREPALGGIFKLGRSAVDAGALDAVTGLPLPKSFREGAKSVMGPATERYQRADKWTTPRQQAAADLVLQQQGQSPAKQGIGILQQMADDRLARDMALGREAAAAKRSALEEATKAAQEKAAQAAAQQAEKEAIKEGGRIIKERQAAEKAAQAAAPKAAEATPISEANKLVSEQMAKDPTFILGLSNPHGVPRNDAQMSEFSKVLKDQMERRATKEVEEKATSLMDKALGGDHSELSVGSPAFKTTAGALGFDADRLKSELITLAQEKPELKTAVGKLFTSGVSPTKKEFYKIQDTIAAKYGIEPVNPNAGVLNVTPVSGALSSETAKANNIANFVRGLPDEQIKLINGRNADTTGKAIASQKAYAVAKLSKIVDDIKAGKDVPAADLELVKSLGLQ